MTVRFWAPCRQGAGPTFLVASCGSGWEQRVTAGSRPCRPSLATQSRSYVSLSTQLKHHLLGDTCLGPQLAPWECLPCAIHHGAFRRAATEP